MRKKNVFKKQLTICWKLFMGWLSQFRACYAVLDTSLLSKCHISVRLTSFPHIYAAQIWLVPYYKLEIRKASSPAITGFEGVGLEFTFPMKCRFQLYYVILCTPSQRSGAGGDRQVRWLLSYLLEQPLVESKFQISLGDPAVFWLLITHEDRMAQIICSFDYCFCWQFGKLKLILSILASICM